MTSSFRKVLVANRGEIALRVMRSARDAGYRTVACTRAPTPARATSARPTRRSASADRCRPSPTLKRRRDHRRGAHDRRRAVRPGYGFLAENEEFAAACRKAGLVFIGPSPEAILAMGNKAGAKRLMSAAGVPCVPGYEGDDQSGKRLAAEADRIGYPVMIKAVAGGGGRGMRLVAGPKEFAELLRSAQSEAKNAFGDPTVILERAIVEPRHIEIQIFADRHGNAIHLGERDCSVQRRHQKVIEEAPSPAVSAELRQRMGAAAVAAAKAIAYEGAGTLEFLLDRDGRYYFMEMNTRLQVEHPVTEAITGLDLVALQLRVAAGEPLPLSQEQVQFNGHAIEVRLCAEDADKGFMPQSGTMALWQPPIRLRVEHALQSGTEIPPYYDSMIAKIISHGETREEARRKLVTGLQDTVALGVTTNQVFLVRCLEHPEFEQGLATTAFIGRHQQALLQKDEAEEQRASTLAAALLVETSAGARQRGAGRRLTQSLPNSMRFEIDGRQQAATLTDLGAHRHQISLDGRHHELEVLELASHRVRFLCEGLMESAAYLREGARLLVCLRGVPHEVIDTTRVASARQEGANGGDGMLRASMNGRVVAVLIKLGERVAAGQPLITLEAMRWSTSMPRRSPEPSRSCMCRAATK
jgi:geranyl-CoA carboxylase alpha subunit